MNFHYILLFLFISHNTYAGTIYLTPAVFGGINENPFDSNARDGCNLAIIALRDAVHSKGHTLLMLPHDTNFLDKECWFIVFDVPREEKIIETLKRYPKERSILLIGEPPSVLPNNYLPSLHTDYKMAFTFFHELVDNKRYFTLYYPQPFLNMIDDIMPFNQKKLCTMIVGAHASNHPDELYSKRNSTLSFFENMHPEQFDFYGWGWSSQNHPCYRGTVQNKLPYLRSYKFAICYENMTSKTYITEKMFDILHAGCVPVYWGAQEISKFIPHNAYILRENFESDEELYQFLNTMPEDDYQKYLDAGKEFFDSPQAAKFSIASFVDTMLKALFD